MDTNRRLRTLAERMAMIDALWRGEYSFLDFCREPEFGLLLTEQQYQQLREEFPETYGAEDVVNARVIQILDLCEKQFLSSVDRAVLWAGFDDSFERHRHVRVLVQLYITVVYMYPWPSEFLPPQEDDPKIDIETMMLRYIELCEKYNTLGARSGSALAMGTTAAKYLDCMVEMTGRAAETFEMFDRGEITEL